GRPADPNGLAGPVAFLAQGGTPEQLEVSWLASDEYYGRFGGGTAAGFVQALYQTVLGRAASAAEVQGGTQALAGGTSRAALAAALVNGVEALTLKVQGDFDQLLHRAPDSVGLNSVVAALQRGLRNEDLIAALVSSAEYYGLVQ